MIRLFEKAVIVTCTLIFMGFGVYGLAMIGTAIRNVAEARP